MVLADRDFFSRCAVVGERLGAGAVLAGVADEDVCQDRSIEMLSGKTVFYPAIERSGSPLLPELFDHMFGGEVEVDLGRQQRVMA